MTLLIQCKEPCMALYLTTQYISDTYKPELSTKTMVDLDDREMERRGLIEDDGE